MDDGLGKGAIPTVDSSKLPLTGKAEHDADAGAREANANGARVETVNGRDMQLVFYSGQSKPGR